MMSLIILVFLGLHIPIYFCIGVLIGKINTIQDAVFRVVSMVEETYKGEQEGYVDGLMDVDDHEEAWKTEIQNEVDLARKHGVCRICKKDIRCGEGVVYNYGKEYAHTKCLEQEGKLK